MGGARAPPWDTQRASSDEEHGAASNKLSTGQAATEQTSVEKKKPEIRESKLAKIKVTTKHDEGLNSKMKVMYLF